MILRLEWYKIVNATRAQSNNIHLKQLFVKSYHIKIISKIINTDGLAEGAVARTPSVV